MTLEGDIVIVAGLVDEAEVNEVLPDWALATIVNTCPVEVTIRCGDLLIDDTGIMVILVGVFTGERAIFCPDMNFVGEPGKAVIYFVGDCSSEGLIVIVFVGDPNPIWCETVVSPCDPIMTICWFETGMATGCV